MVGNKRAAHISPATEKPFGREAQVSSNRLPAESSCKPYRAVIFINTIRHEGERAMFRSDCRDQYTFTAWPECIPPDSDFRAV